MSRIEEIQKQIEELTKKTQELQKELELEKQKTEIEYPFHFKGECWQLRIDGLVKEDWWSASGYDRNCYQQGNMFTTQQEAIKERERRILLTRFRKFRDKCNGDWKPDWEVIEDSYNYYIEMYYGYGNAKLRTDWSPSSASFNLFGYFEKKEDCDRAIELFGNEIIRLWVEEK